MRILKTVLEKCNKQEMYEIYKKLDKKTKNKLIGENLND